MKLRLLLNMVLVGVLLVMGSTVQATDVTLDATEDAEIDGHVNWRNDPKGIPNAGWLHPATELPVKIYDPIDYPGAEAAHSMIKWDVSSIPSSDVVTAVTLEMSGWDWSDGPIDVYGIEVGDWAEATVSWNSWAATTKSLALLGQLASAGPASVTGQTQWSDADLTALVQDWVDGDQANYGIILKKAGTTPGVDSFSSREDTWASGHAPQLKITHEIPEPITAVLLVGGILTLARRRRS